MAKIHVAALAAVLLLAISDSSFAIAKVLKNNRARPSRTVRRILVQDSVRIAAIHTLMAAIIGTPPAKTGPIRTPPA